MSARAWDRARHERRRSSDIDDQVRDRARAVTITPSSEQRPAHLQSTYQSF
jgi:hypothetical protein